MKLPGKIARYLRGNVDFDSFSILDIAAHDKDNAIIPTEIQKRQRQNTYTAQMQP